MLCETTRHGSNTPKLWQVDWGYKTQFGKHDQPTPGSTGNANRTIKITPEDRGLKKITLTFLFLLNQLHMFISFFRSVKNLGVSELRMLIELLTGQFLKGDMIVYG